MLEGAYALSLNLHEAWLLKGHSDPFIVTHLSNLNKLLRASYFVLLEGSSAVSLVLRGAWLLEAASDSSGVASSLGGVPPTLVIICTARLPSGRDWE